MANVPMNADTTDASKRSTEINNIILITRYLHKKFYDEELKFKENDILNLDESNAVAEVLYQFYYYMKTINNPNVSAQINDNEVKAKIGNKSFSIPAMAEEFKTLNKDFEVDFMVAIPLVDMLTSFRCMYQEIRMSCRQIEIKINYQKQEVKISRFGLENSDARYLTGVTFKPHRRSRLMETMGPLTLALLLANENRYMPELERSLLDSLKLLPMAQAVVDKLKSMNSALNGYHVFQSLGKVLRVLGPRWHNQIHFPLYYLVAMADINPHIVKEFNFSGVKGIRMYNDYCTKLIWQKNTCGISEDVSQVVFHSIFGTSIVDLSILRQITTHTNWKNRIELNGVFEKRTGPCEKVFTPIRFTYIPQEVESANMLRNKRTFQPQISCCEVFAGKRKKHYSQEFLQYIGASSPIIYSSDPSQIILTINKCLRDIEEGKISEQKTTTWFDVTNNYALVYRTFNKNDEFLYM